MSETIKSLLHEALTEPLDAFQHPVHDYHRISCCRMPKLLHEAIEHGVVSLYCVIGVRHQVFSEPDPCKKKLRELDDDNFVVGRLTKILGLGVIAKEITTLDRLLTYPRDDTLH